MLSVGWTQASFCTHKLYFHIHIKDGAVAKRNNLCPHPAPKHSSLTTTLPPLLCQHKHLHWIRDLVQGKDNFFFFGHIRSDLDQIPGPAHYVAAQTLVQGEEVARTGLIFCACTCPAERAHLLVAMSAPDKSQHRIKHILISSLTCSSRLRHCIQLNVILQCRFVLFN